MLVFLVLGAVPGGTLARASVLGHNPRRLVPVVLRPTWHAVARTGAVDVAVSGRYVFIGGATGSGALIDEQTGKRVVLTPPAGCAFDNFNGRPLGGSWVVARCSAPPPGPPYPFELYSISNGTWAPFTPDTTQLFAANSDCSTGDPACAASFTAIGAHWIEFYITCGDHCGAQTTYSFQNIQTGQVVGEPVGTTPGGNRFLDLDAETLTEKLCSPLKVPGGFPDQSGKQTPGTLLLSGPFAVALDWSSDGLTLRYVLERCGARLHETLVSPPGGFPVAINQHAVVWPGTALSDTAIHGVFLPSRRNFKVTGLRASASTGPTKAIQQVALTPRTLYVLDGSGRVYAAAAPLQPKRQHH
jgi:hypothetical protein